ncbi:MAG: hypothetical protein WC564_02255 [Patescibacteria group bacterium]|jgi:hypothetical protein
MRKKLLSFILPAFFILFIVFPVLAQTPSTPPPATPSASVVTLDNPLAGAGIETPQQLIGRVISAVLGVVGSLALIMFIYGGLVWMTAAGNEKKVMEGRDILMWAAIGLIIIFASYAAVRFLIGEVIGA